MDKILHVSRRKLKVKKLVIPGSWNSLYMQEKLGSPNIALEE